MTAAALERYAVEWCAEAGYVPPRLWYALTAEARERVGKMSRWDARSALRPVPRRASTSVMDAAALADLIERSVMSFMASLSSAAGYSAELYVIQLMTLCAIGAEQGEN